MLSFIDYQEIMDDDIIFYAHTSEMQQKETLKEHIERCEKYFQKIYDDKNVEAIIKRFHQKLHFQSENATFDYLKNLLIQLVSFHDLGKINPEFQRVKMNHNVGKKYEGLVDCNHSFLSSVIYLDYFLKQLSLQENLCSKDKQLLQRMILEHAYIIARHHSDLESFSQFTRLLSNSQTIKLIQNLQSNPLYGYKGLLYINERNLKLLLRNISKKEKNESIDIYNFKYFYYRLIYSLLVTSDYYATSEFMNQKKFDIVSHVFTIQDFQKEYNQSKLLKNIRNYEKVKYQGRSKNFGNITEINDLRSELFLDAEKCLFEHFDEDIYFLEAPTGSGKSNTAINLSFHLMQNRKKLLYIYPFNTLVEQNKNTLNTLFSQQKFQEQIVVVNSLTPLPNHYNNEEDSQIYYQKLLLDRQFLNYPFILSTHVSFFNLLFGYKKEDVIGFHQLSESVIVLDEIQSYKNSIWAEMIIMLQSCAELMDMKLIIMSATLPNLEQLSRKNNIVRHLLPHSHLYFQHHLFKERVKLHYELLNKDIDLEKLRDHIIATQQIDKKILVEFITKDSAYQFYKLLKNSKDIIVEVKCLTGDDSMIEREKILAPIKNNKIKGIILISTQVIEAGVDIDMDIGYKDISLLDCEEQFLGRINRSCRKKGEAYFFNYDKYKMIYRHDMRANDALTLQNDDMKVALINKDFSSYYEQVMESLELNRNKSTNERGLSYFFNEDVYKLDFHNVFKRMKLIDDDSYSVDVVLCRKIELEDGTILDGWDIWNRYKDLLQNNDMEYSQKQVKLIEVRSLLNHFIYRFKNSTDLQYNDIIGELRCIEDASDYFIDDHLDIEKLEQSSYDFI